MEEEKEVGKKVEHTPAKVEMANGSGRVRCSCGWESLMQDDGFMWTPKKDVPVGFTQDAAGDWQKHVDEARGQEESQKPVLASDWRAPAGPARLREVVDGEWAEVAYPGVSKLTWLAGMIASGLAANPVAVQPDQGLTQAHARAIVASAVELAKALDEAEAEG